MNIIFKFKIKVKIILLILNFILLFFYTLFLPRLVYCAARESKYRSGWFETSCAFDIKTLYEGRFNIVDPGDSSGRHGIFNILWIDASKKDTDGVEIVLKAKAFGFEGDSSIKRYNGIDELEAVILNEAYLNKTGPCYDLKFGSFHNRIFSGGYKPLFDLTDPVYSFDIMNDKTDKKAKGGLYYSRAVDKSTAAFVNYQFNVDYANSLKTFGINYGDFCVMRTFDLRKDYFIIDYDGHEKGAVNYKASYRKNMFNYLSPVTQFRAGGDFKIKTKFGRSRFEIDGLGLEFLANNTSNGYYHLKRNAVDLISGNVNFFYQKYIAALKLDSKFYDRFNSSLKLEGYFSLKPQFGLKDGLNEDINSMSVYKISSLSHYKKTAVEAAVSKIVNNDGSFLLNEKFNFRLRVLYPF